MEWKTVKLGDYIDDIAAGPFGSNLKVECFVEDGFPIIDGANLRGFTVTDNVTKFVTEEKARSLHRSIATRGEVIVTISGNVGQIAYIPNDSQYDEYLVSQRQFRVRFKNNISVPYLVYYMHSREGQYKILSFANQTGVPALAQPLKNFRNIELPLPPRETQRRIAAILSSLDDKIENNNRINRNLEAQAQALFKSWFVDFEPWDGTMPEDWGEGVYNDIIEKTISGDWGKERPEGNYDHSVACIRGCDFEDINNGIRGKTPQRYILEKNYQNKGLKNRDIVVEISGGTATVSTGRVCLITEKLLQKYDYDIVCTNFCRTIRPLADYYTYLYYSWKYKYDQRIMFGYENGTSGIKNFAIKDFIEKEPLIIPSCDVVKSFNKVISVLHDKSQENGTESSRLATLRDTLLPKLMKGEIEV